MKSNSYGGRMFLDVLRFRMLSHLTFGARRRRYEGKWRMLKNSLHQAERRRFFLLGLPLFDVVCLGALRACLVCGLPVLVFGEYANKKYIRLFGVIELCKSRMFRKAEGGGLWAEEEILSWSEMSADEQAVYAVLKECEEERGGAGGTDVSLASPAQKRGIDSEEAYGDAHSR